MTRTPFFHSRSRWVRTGTIWIVSCCSQMVSFHHLSTGARTSRCRCSGKHTPCHKGPTSCAADLVHLRMLLDISMKSSSSHTMNCENLSMLGILAGLAVASLCENLQLLLYEIFEIAISFFHIHTRKQGHSRWKAEPLESSQHLEVLLLRRKRRLWPKPRHTFEIVLAMRLLMEEILHHLAPGMYKPCK